MKPITYALLVALSLYWTFELQAATVRVAAGPDGKDRIVLDNGIVRLQVSPSRGGRVDSFRYVPWGDVEIIKHAGHGLFNDHFWQESWPGQFWEASYAYRIIGHGPDEASVRLSCLSKDAGVPLAAGILLEKTLTLREHDRAIHETVRLTNTTRHRKYVGYWQQHVCWLGGTKEGDRYFRPSKRGVSRISSEDADPPDGGYVREPQAGWTAAIDRATRGGLVFLMDYNDLRFLYNCPGAGTTEWQYNAIEIPPGKFWETSVTMIPTSDLGDVSYASSQLLSGQTCREDQATNRLAITQSFEAASGALPSLDAAFSLSLPLTNQPQSATVSRHLTGVGTTAQTLTLALPYDVSKREPAALRLALNGCDDRGNALAVAPEFWYGGKCASNANMTDGGPIYAIPSAARRKSAIKPDKIVRIVAPKAQVLFLRGLLTTAYDLDAALQSIAPPVEVKKSYGEFGEFTESGALGAFGCEIDYFPYDYDALMRYDLVIISDLSSGFLGDTAMEMLADYVRHGGHLLVLGGPFAYGNGGYRGTPLGEILPVVCQGPFDLKPTQGILKAARSLSGIRSLEEMHFAYMHEVTAKAGSEVFLSCGGKPLLVAGKYGEGAVCCFTGTPQGAANGCATPQWRQLVIELFKKLGLTR